MQYLVFLSILFVEEQNNSDLYNVEINKPNSHYE